MKRLGWDARVGILGGGQLARMLAEAAFRLGLHPIVFAGDADDPAARLCPGSVFGSMKDAVAVRRFLSQVDHVIFENEFIDCAFLESLLPGEELPLFSPALSAIHLLQDKLRQKALLQELGIPTSDFVAFDPARDSSLEAWIQEVDRRFEGQFVLKWAQSGYDGKGTWISPRAGLAGSKALAFARDAIRRGVPLFAERKIAFRREVAVVASYRRPVPGEAGSGAGAEADFKAYPLVISEQENGICRQVIGPARAHGVAAPLERLAHEFAGKIARRCGLYGTFAIEMFETEEGTLCVNELAPRVHNTGHYTQDASRTSQFENHWRAVLGLPLGDTACAPGFAMRNLLGPRKGAPETSRPPVGSPRIHLHWYGKRDARPGRKMGHLNGVVESADELPGLIRELQACEKEWSKE